MSFPRHSATVGRSNNVRRTATLLLSGLLLTVPFSAAANAQDAPIAGVSRADPYADFIAQASQRFGVPERWIRAVMRVESAGNVRAISSVGAMGLMQIMPATWAELRARHGLGTNPWRAR